jgi:hypothetical protein
VLFFPTHQTWSSRESAFPPDPSNLVIPRARVLPSRLFKPGHPESPRFSSRAEGSQSLRLCGRGEAVFVGPDTPVRQIRSPLRPIHIVIPRNARDLHIPTATGNGTSSTRATKPANTINPSAPPGREDDSQSRSVVPRFEFHEAWGIRCATNVGTVGTDPNYYPCSRWCW